MFARVAAFGFCIKQGMSLSDPVDRDRDLRHILEMLDPLTREALHRVLIHDQADPDAVSSQLLRYRDGHGDDWADIIDMMTRYPEERRRVVRLLAKVDAGSWSYPESRSDRLIADRSGNGIS
jgi:hypothetical protein